jgi:hypothetical protein
VLAGRGFGTAGTTQGHVTGGFRQTIRLELFDAEPNTGYDVYIDQEGRGDAASNRFVGTFTTDANGDGSFVGSIVVAVAASEVDNAIVFEGSPFSGRKYAQEGFAPCPAR